MQILAAFGPHLKFAGYDVFLQVYQETYSSSTPEKPNSEMPDNYGAKILLGQKTCSGKSWAGCGVCIGL